MKDNHTLDATGTCFDDISAYARQLVINNNFDLTKFTKWPKIVHGICIMKNSMSDTIQNGKPYAHCWLEMSQNIVIDSHFWKGKIVYLDWPKAKFYKFHKVKKYIKYTFQEVYENEIKFGCAGPWDLEIIQLCKDYKENKPYQESHLLKNFKKFCEIKRT